MIENTHGYNERTRCLFNFHAKTMPTLHKSRRVETDYISDLRILKSPLRRIQMTYIERNASRRHSAMQNTAREANLLQTQVETGCAVLSSELRAKCLLRGVRQKHVLQDQVQARCWLLRRLERDQTCPQWKTLKTNFECCNCYVYTLPNACFSKIDRVRTWSE